MEEQQQILIQERLNNSFLFYFQDVLVAGQTKHVHMIPQKMYQEKFILKDISL